MNERIEALKKLATKEVWGNNPHNGSPEFDGYELDADMFAELIVQECIAHGKLTQSQTVVNGSEEYNSGREMGIEVFMNQIKQHFGVKE